MGQMPMHTVLCTPNPDEASNSRDSHTHAPFPHPPWAAPSTPGPGLYLHSLLKTLGPTVNPGTHIAISHSPL